MRLYQWEYNFRQDWLPKLLLLCLLLTGTLEGLGIAAAQAECDTPSVPQDKLQPLISSDSPGYRTPRTGEGFRTELFGREIKVQPENILGGRDKVIFLIVKEVFGNKDIVPLPLEIIIKIVPLPQPHGTLPLQGFLPRRLFYLDKKKVPLLATLDTYLIRNDCVILFVINHLPLRRKT